MEKLDAGETAETINSLVHDAFDRHNQIDMTAVSDLMDVILGEMKYQVLDRFMEINQKKEVNQKHVMVRIDSMLRYFGQGDRERLRLSCI